MVGDVPVLELLYVKFLHTLACIHVQTLNNFEEHERCVKVRFVMASERGFRYFTLAGRTTTSFAQRPNIPFLQRGCRTKLSWWDVVNERQFRLFFTLGTLAHQPSPATATRCCCCCCCCRWYNSIIFDKDWFGSALGSPENDFLVSEGRFANISTIYDPPLDDTDASRTLEYPAVIHP